MKPRDFFFFFCRSEQLFLSHYISKEKGGVSNISNIYHSLNNYCFKFDYSLVKLAGTDEEVRLVDDAFGKVCNAVNDLSMNIRKQSAQLLGTMALVSPRFLQQTLDKKLFSNMRVIINPLFYHLYLFIEYNHIITICNIIFLSYFQSQLCKIKNLIIKKLLLH